MTGRTNSSWAVVRDCTDALLDANRSVSASPGGSYVEVWIYPGRVDVFERQGQAETARLIEILRKLGLQTRARTMSFCG